MASTGPAGAGAGPQTLRDPTPEQTKSLRAFLRTNDWNDGTKTGGKLPLQRWYEANPNVRVDLEVPDAPYPTLYHRVMSVGMNPVKGEGDLRIWDVPIEGTGRTLLEETLNRRPNPTLTSRETTVSQSLEENFRRKGWANDPEAKAFLDRVKEYERKWNETNGQIQEVKKLADALARLRLQGNDLTPQVEAKIGSYFTNEKGSLEQQAKALRERQGAPPSGGRSRRRHRRGRKTQRRRTRR
jgi:hypothetical protein